MSKEDTTEEVGFDLGQYIDKDAPKPKPRIHKAGDDSVCVSCEG